MKLLYAEDEPALSDAVADVLSHHNFHVDVVSNGIDVMSYVQIGHYDGLILDIMMPGKNGMDVLGELRAKGITIPILMLTAKGEVNDRVNGLSFGADDYLTKPFAMKELVARVQAMLRRRDNFVPDIIDYGNTSLDLSRIKLSTREGEVELSRLEFRIMEMFMLHQGLKISSGRILEEVWGYDSEVTIDTLWVHISQLRKKLAGISSNLIIESKRGIGYSLEVEG